MSSIVAPLLALLALGVVIVILLPWPRIVPEQERLVIFRLGRFHRISGPGLVWRLARIESIEETYDTANRPRNLPVNNILIHGIEANLRVNLWLRTDLVEAAGGDGARLGEMALLGEPARGGQVSVEVKRALNEGLARVAAAHPLSPNPGLLDKLAVLLPGSERCEELLNYMSGELAARLRAFGVILDATKRIAITEVQLPDDVVQVLSRARLLDSLSQQLPELAPDVRAQVAASMEGREPLRIQQLVVKSQGGGAGVIRERMALKDGSLVDVALGPAAVPAAAPDQAGAPNPPPAAPKPAGHAEELSKEDLQVLKRVPPYSRSPERKVG